MTVSVIVPVKNGGRFLRESLASVVRQAHPPLEVLVIDNASTDETRAIAESFGAPVKYLRNDPELSIAATRNRGLALARGELLAFNSHDDLWLPQKLALQCEWFARNPELQLCVTHLRCFVDPDEEAKPAAFPNHLLDQDLPGWVPETLVARRLAFARAGLFDPSFAQGDDTEWFARARQLGLTTLMLNDSLVRKRLHSRSITYGATKPALASRETLEIARRMIAARRREGRD
jgi:glycosyltransferase involved in cell wall biosynthesis